MKKVTFNDDVQVHVIPREPRRSTWVVDRCRFMQRVHGLERLFKSQRDLKFELLLAGVGEMVYTGKIREILNSCKETSL